MEKETIIVKRAESEEESNALDAFCHSIYYPNENFGAGETVFQRAPDKFFGAYIKDQIVGTVGLLTKNTALLPTEQRCGVEFSDGTHEVTRLSWAKGLMLPKLTLVAGSLIYGIYLDLKEKLNGNNSFIGIVKPKTFHFLKRILGEDTFLEVRYEKINGESINDQDRHFYSEPPKPIIFKTDCQRAERGLGELISSINMKIRPVNLGA